MTIQYRVCGITKGGAQTAWSIFETREAMLKKANELLEMPGIIAFKTWEVILP
jgi:hypothetical protein